MPRSYIVDASALVGLLDQREPHHDWARETLLRIPRPWLTCESVIAETFFLVHGSQAQGLDQMVRGGHLRIALDLTKELSRILDLRFKYADVPMSLADACLVRLSEILPDPLIVTTDSDFKIYRRHSRQVIPVRLP